MKIVYVITKADEIGGAQVHVRDLSVLAQKDGHDVTVITGEKGELVNQLCEQGVNTIIVPSIVRNIDIVKDTLAIFRLVKIIKELKPDIVGLHSSKAGIIGRIACFLTRVPVVFTAHGWAFANGISERKRQIYMLIEMLFAPLASKIITVSEQDKKLAISCNVANESQQVVIHNGVGDLFSCLEKDSEKVVRMIMVARFSAQKDHETLVKSLSEIQGLNWHLDLVGKGPNLEIVKRSVVSLGLSDRVSFLGERNDMSNLLSKSDIFLLISNWEGYPMSILEAMSCKLPVIVSDVGGVSEAVAHNVNGYLVQRKDSNQLIIHLRELIQDADLRQRFGQQNRIEYETKHTVHAMYDKTLDLYRKVIDS